jgi:RimJ/RimL family protein N-acetyltransferase
MLVMARTPEVRAFRPDDAWRVLNRDGRQSSPERMLKQTQHGPAFTAYLDDRILACGGLMILWPGMGIGWMAVTEEAAGYGIWLSKTVKRIARTMIRLHGLHRIEALALTESPVNQRWLEWLGFTRERDGIARQYLPDKRSMIRYEWVGG